MSEAFDLEQQYKLEIAQIGQITREQEQRLILLARQGDRNARQEIVKSLLFYIEYTSWPYARFRDPLDLCQIASIAVIESLEKALETSNPYGYLIRVAQLSMMSECRKHSNVLDRDSRQGPPVQVESLEHLLRLLDMGMQKERKQSLDLLLRLLEERLVVQTSQAQERDWSRLYAAIECLSPQQREVILYSFGLDNRPEESPSVIGQLLGIPPAGRDIATAVGKRRNVALKRLYNILSTGKIKQSNNKTIAASREEKK